MNKEIVTDEVLTRLEMIRAVEMLLWAQKNLHNVFSTGSEIYVWIDTDVDKCRRFTSLKALSSYIDGLRTGGWKPTEKPQ